MAPRHLATPVMPLAYCANVQNPFSICLFMSIILKMNAQYRVSVYRVVDSAKWSNAWSAT